MPPLVGSVSDHVPAVAAVCIVTTPLVNPERPSVPEDVPATPRTGVTVNEGTPLLLALRMPPFVVASPAIVFAELE